MHSISIIIPIYNVEKVLSECMNSIFLELDDAIECFLIDDGSTDNSYEIAKSYSTTNVHVLHHENRGVSYTRNRGIMAADGEYIMFVDADDKLISGWKKHINKSMEEKPDICYFSKQLHGKNPDKKVIIESIIGISNQGGNMTAPWSKIYRRKLLINNHISFNPQIMYGEDLLVNLEAVIKAEKLQYYPKSIYLYRVNPHSVTHTFNYKWFQSNLNFLQLEKTILESTDIMSSFDVVNYLSFSFHNSIPTYLHMIYYVKDKHKQNEVLLNLRDQRIQYYFDEYDKNHYLPKKIMICNKMVQTKNEKIALYFWVFVKRLGKLKIYFKKGKNTEWITI